VAVAHRADGAVVDFEAGAGGVGPKKRIDGVAIADRVRKVLGMPPLGAPIPGYGPGGK
jgi:hypothetical protein